MGIKWYKPSKKCSIGPPATLKKNQNRGTVGLHSSVKETRGLPQPGMGKGALMARGRHSW